MLLSDFLCSLGASHGLLESSMIAVMATDELGDGSARGIGTPLPKSDFVAARRPRRQKLSQPRASSRAAAAARRSTATASS